MATKEDIATITDNVEEVKAQYAATPEERKAGYQLPITLTRRLPEVLKSQNRGGKVAPFGRILVAQFG
ncbi:MAG: hypothetical protein HYU64_01595 [Armatimonadetes bacterium]|nr:hypothetical protein [Armatimonadota bacterium]